MYDFTDRRGHSIHFIPIVYCRAEPDDLYDPPPEPLDPYLIDEDDVDMEYFDGMEEIEENEDEDDD